MGRKKPSANTNVSTHLPAVGALLALGVIRVVERTRNLDSRTEESVSTGVLTTKENARD